jgi:hypothetical protein
MSVEAIKQWLDDVSRVILPSYRRQHFQQVSTFSHNLYYKFLHFWISVFLTGPELSTSLKGLDHEIEFK